VSRSDMSQEYLRGVTDQHLTYAQLKMMARTSLEHAFLQGDSLWRDEKKLVRVKDCALDHPDRENVSDKCQDFLKANPRANLQWELEQQLADFEAKW